MSSTNAKVADRRSNMYKKGIDKDVCSRRREETTIRIRKNKRTEQLLKRRNIRPTQVDSAASAGAAEASGLEATLDGLPALANAIKRGPPELQFQAVRMVRKLLSREHDPPVQAVLDQDVLSHLVQFLTREDTMFEAAWALTNIASTDHTSVVVDAGACPHLVNLLRCTNSEVREQAAWCLGNIAGDQTKYRDYLLSQTQCLNNVLMNIKEPASESLLRNVTWSLSNLCRGKPKPKLEHIKPAFPALRHLLSIADEEVVTDACWALSYVSDGEDARIEEVVKSGAVPLLINMMGSTQKVSIMTPALRTIGNIVSGNDKCTQHCLDNNLLQVLGKLINHHKKAVRKETCWALSNITAGTQHQITQVANYPGILVDLISHVRDSEWDVKKEAAWAVANMTTTATPEVVCKVVDAKAIEPLVNLLDVKDSKIVTVALEAVESILKTGRKCGRDFAMILEECGGIDMLENLQQHESTKIYEKTLKILETFFSDDDAEEENAAPATFVQNAPGGPVTFDFKPVGMPQPAAPSAPVSFNFHAPQQESKGFDFSNLASC
jgi:importin subunit alpha-6/7